MSGSQFFDVLLSTSNTYKIFTDMKLTLYSGQFDYGMNLMRIENSRVAHSKFCLSLHNYLRNFLQYVLTTNLETFKISKFSCPPPFYHHWNIFSSKHVRILKKLMKKKSKNVKKSIKMVKSH